MIDQPPLVPASGSQTRAEPSSPAGTADEKLLHDTYQVLELLLAAEESPVARAWFMGMNPHLDDAPPAEALADG